MKAIVVVYQHKGGRRKEGTKEKIHMHEQDHTAGGRGGDGGV